MDANDEIEHAKLGDLVFTPVADWHGQASFTFKVVDQSDAVSAAAATATVTVNSVADDPVAAALSLSTAEDTALSFAAADFEGVYTDGDGDDLKEVTVVSLPASTAGALVLDDGETETAVKANDVIASGSLGKLKFTPAANFAGQGTFGFKVVDATNAASDQATATITVTPVNDAPAASALSLSTAEDTALTFTAADFEGSFSDPDGSDSLKEVKVVSLPAATEGTLALDDGTTVTAVDANDEVEHAKLGDLVFTPVADWHGQASFTFKVVDQSDAVSADAATATVTVSSVADAPVASALSKSTAEDTALTFAAADFEGVYTDGDGDDLKEVKVVSLPASTAGDLALDDGETETAVKANDVIASGSLGKLKFTPATNFAGQATFGFKAVDATNAASAEATATITVTPVNDAPAASALSLSTAEDTALTFTATDFDGIVQRPGRE